MSTDTNKLTRDIIKYLRFNGVFCWRNNNGAVYDPRLKLFRKPPPDSIKGVPDILGVLQDGTFLGIEVKTGTDKLSPEQKEFIKNAEINSAVCFEARSLQCVQGVIDAYLGAFGQTLNVAQH